MLRQQISDSVKDAMRAHDTVKLSVYRYILSEIKNREIDVKHDLSDEEVTEILRREVKRRSEAIVQFEQGGRTDIAEQEKTELALIQSLLPQMMSQEEVEKIVDQVVANGDTNFGSVMKTVMQQVKGKADGKLVSDVVKSKLGQ